jgi:uncharacterized protein
MLSGRAACRLTTLRLQQFMPAPRPSAQNSVPPPRRPRTRDLPTRTTSTLQAPTSTPPPLPPPSASPPPRGLAAAIGLTGGLLGACAGMGGAVFMVPGLVRFFAMAQPTAAGSSMMAVVAVSATSVGAHAAHASADGGSGVCWPIAAMVAAPAALATPFGASLAPRINPALLRRALGSFLLALAPILPLRAMMLKQRAEGGGVAATEVAAVLGASAEERVDGAARELAPSTRAALVAGGVGIGFAAGMLGISGGSLMTPLIAVLQPDLPVPVILGTSFAAMLPPSVVAAVVYSRLGLVRWGIVAPLAAGACGGALVGSKVVMSIPEDVLRWGFAAVFFTMGFRIVRTPLRAAVKRATPPAR